MTDHEFDHALDDIMRGKLEEKNFELKGSYWKDARKLIRNDRRKKLQGFFLASVVLLGLIGASMALIEGNHLKAMSGNRHLPADEQSKLQASATRPFSAPQKTTVLPTADHHGAQKDPAVFSHSSPANKPTHQQVKSDPRDANELPDETGRQVRNNTIKVKKHPVKDGVSTFISVRMKKKQRHEYPVFTTSVSNPVTADAGIPSRRIRANNLHSPAGITAMGYQPVTGHYSLCDTCLHKTDIYLAYAIRHAKAKQKQFLAAEAGITYYNPSASITANPNFTVGMRYYRFLGKKINVSAGLFYSRLHQDLSDLTFEKVKYTFGKTIDKTTVSILRADYLELPALVSYRMAGNHFISAGASVSYLVNASSLVITRKSADNKNTNVTESGHTYALHKTDVQLQIGYTVFLPKGFILSATYGYGLYDVSDNSIFHSGAFDRNTGIRISAGYKLVR